MRAQIFFFFLQLAVLLPQISAQQCEPFVLTLETAISRALNFNRSILGSDDNVTQAEYQVSVADGEFDLMIYPNGNLGYVGGGYAGSGLAWGTGVDFVKRLPWGTRIDIMPSLEKVHDNWHTNARTRITQPLLRGLGREFTYANVYAAQFSWRSAMRAQYLAQCQLIIRTVGTLYDLIKTYKSVELSEKSFERIRKFYQAAKLKSKIGLADPLDIYRAETEMRQAEDMLTSSKERFQEVEDHLRDILALPPDIPLEVDIPMIFTHTDIPVDEAIGTALTNRIEIDQAEDALQDNRRVSKLAQDRLWPALDFVLNYSNCGADQVFTECFSTRRETTWGFGFTTSTDFNPVAQRAVVDQTLIAISASGRNLDQVKSNVTFDIKRVLRRLERSRQKIELQEKQIHTARGELRLSEIKFNRGMANNFDMIQAEKTLRTSELNYWNALIDHIVEEYHLLNSLGMLIEKPQC